MVKSSFLLLFLFLFLPALSAASDEGSDIIGKKAPEFKGLIWLNTEPITLKQLNGKVVLIRFWLVDCPYCTNTAPSLVEFYNKYKDDGFIVIGIHHPKSERSKDNTLVKRWADKFGFNFPVAQDLDWETINTFWLGGKKRSFTSLSILIDRQGIIRFVHDGGEFYKSESNLEANDGYDEVNIKIQELLGE